MNPITTPSRYGDKRTIECVDSEKGIFKIYGKAHFCRQGEAMFDFEGGPFYAVGGDFHGRGDISYVVAVPSAVPADQDITGVGCLVTVKLNKDAKREIKKWNDNLPIINALKQEVSEWLNNGQ